MKEPRICGSCSACCTFLRIDSEPGVSTRLDTMEDIAKPAGVQCRFLSAQGCGIYEVRPIVCRNFKCDWLLGRKGFNAAESPSKVGYFALKGSIFAISKQSPPKDRPKIINSQK